MQTFLPCADYERSAALLDSRRLGKQRVEVLQIANVLTGQGTAWRHHPAVRMWRGHVNSLIRYGLAICREWVSRDADDSVMAKLCAISDGGDESDPPWLGFEPFHRAHRSNLIRKDPDHYRKVWPNDPDNLPYIWPVEWPVLQIGRKGEHPPVDYREL